MQSALDTLATADAAKVFDRATFDGLWHTLVTQKVDPDCSKPAPAPDKSAEADAPKASTLLNAIKALNGYSADDAVLSLIREAALEVQGSALDDAVKGLAASPGCPRRDFSPTARRAMAALRIFGALDQLYRADAGKLPDVAGVLVALADVRMRQATAKIEADRLAELDRLSKLRLTALAQRAVLLAGAETELANKADAGLTGALRRYAESVKSRCDPRDRHRE